MLYVADVKLLIKFSVSAVFLGLFTTRILNGKFVGLIQFYEQKFVTYPRMGQDKTNSHFQVTQIIPVLNTKLSRLPRPVTSLGQNNYA